MALFGKKDPVICDICGKETGTGTSKKHKTKDGVICHHCFLEAGFPPNGFSGAATTGLIKEQLESSDGLGILERIQKQSSLELDALKEKREAQREESRQKLQDYQEAQASKNEPGPVHCPKCNSTSISADKKGFGVGKAVVGMATAGAIGVVAGNIGAKKVRITCLKCGHQWMAGQG